MKNRFIKLTDYDEIYPTDNGIILYTYYFDISDIGNRITQLYISSISEAKCRYKKVFVITGIKLEKIYRIDGI